jgi:hypothetical protein
MNLRRQSPREWIQIRPILIGAGLAALIITFGELLPEEHLLEFHTLALVFIAAVYIGFASADGRPQALVTEVVGIIVFISLALIGLWTWTPALILGFVGHAGWDLIHGPHGTFGAETVGWYIPFCVIVDLAIGAYLLLYVGL